MDQVFWVYPNEVAGRPGPGVAPWDLASLKAGGIDLIVSLATDLFPHSTAVEAGIRRTCIPFPDVLPPDARTVALCRSSLRVAFDLMRSEVENGGTIMIHCAGGYDRTGLVLARYISYREDLCAEASIRRLRKIRPYALSAEGWEGMAVGLISETRA